MNGEKQKISGQKILMSYLLRYLTFEIKKKMRNQKKRELRGLITLNFLFPRST